MILLDSDHLTLLRYHGNDRSARLVARLEAATELIGTTIINVEETMRGWLAAIAKERLIERQVPGYRELGELFHFFSGFTICMFDEAAAQKYPSLTSKVGSMDRKIAAIALTQ